MDIHQVKKMIDNEDVTIVDIRDEQSYVQGHIAGAVILNRDNLTDFITNTDKEKPVICYCFHGVSSQDAAAFLQEQGFMNVHSMEGGFELWKGTYPVVAG